MFFDIKDFAELDGLSVDELLSRRELVQEKENIKLLEQKRVVHDLKRLIEELQDLNGYNSKIDEILRAKKCNEPAPAEATTYDSSTIVDKYIKIFSTDERDKYIHSLTVSEDMLFEILERDTTNYELYEMQMHILDLNYLSANFLNKVMRLEIDPSMFKLDIKIKALKHQNCDEEALKSALDDKFFDVRNLAAKIAMQNGYKELVESSSQILDESNDFIKLANAQNIVDMMSSNETPDLPKESVKDALSLYEKRLKLSDDKEFVEQNQHKLDVAWEVFKVKF